MLSNDFPPLFQWCSEFIQEKVSVFREPPLPPFPLSAHLFLNSTFNIEKRILEQRINQEEEKLLV